MYQTMLARDMMVTGVITASPEMDVCEAMDLLLQHRISGLPVVDDAGNLVGILSEKDCLPVLIDAVYENMPSMKVGKLMTEPKRTIPPDLDFLAIARIFINEHYRRLPVVDGRRLLGQISRCDLLRVASKMLLPESKHQASFLYLSKVAERGDAPVE